MNKHEHKELIRKYGAETVDKYEVFFREIDPEVIAEAVGDKHAVAFSQNPIGPDVEFSDSKVFFEAIGIFYANQCSLTGRRVPPFDECIEEATKIISRNESDKQEAYRNSKENLEGGFDGVCKKIYEYLLRDEEIAHIKSCVKKCLSWNYSVYEEKEKLAQYYCDTRLGNESEGKKNTLIMKFAQDINFFANWYVNMVEKNRHL